MSDQNDSAMDYAEHDKTYVRFLGMTKYGVIGTLVIVGLMAIFLT
ncbi:MAG: aa3-type cytochrome c oxidase subunit IV [Cohaesibacteraceae bacterium]|nr:aa3-type cytochrome c oxidase subunit IV [Cohaesibacteraceae bacterium]MBL4876103.1 aa3-type cytochrome c oxidase subunit IV [Cohaesibacteraceae bacterium]